MLSNFGTKSKFCKTTLGDPRHHREKEDPEIKSLYILHCVRVMLQIQHVSQQILQLLR